MIKLAGRYISRYVQSHLYITLEYVTAMQLTNVSIATLYT